MADSIESKVCNDGDIECGGVAAATERVAAASAAQETPLNNDEAANDGGHPTLSLAAPASTALASTAPDATQQPYPDYESEQVIFDLSASKRRVVSIEPRASDSEETRRPMPITVGRLDGRLSQIVVTRGLQLLYDVTQLRIQQSFDIDDLTSGLISENRYVVRRQDESGEESVFGCCENSSYWHRILCGSARPFHLILLDPTRQEAATFRRRLASCIPQLGIYLQRMDAYEAGGEHLGSVEQEWSVGRAMFSVRDATRAVLYWIKAREQCCTVCAAPSNFVFYILNGEGSVVSHITHEWDRDLVDYKLSVVLPPSRSTRSKALVLAAAFLFEYMYFLPVKQSGCLKSCCK